MVILFFIFFLKFLIFSWCVGAFVAIILLIFSKNAREEAQDFLEIFKKKPDF